MENPSPVKPPPIRPYIPQSNMREKLFVVLRSFALLILITIMGLVLLDMFVPAVPERAILKDIGTVSTETRTVLGVKYVISHATVTTDDGRKIETQLILPDNAGNKLLPLVIINSAFLRTDDVISMMGPPGDNAVLIYNPNDLFRMFYGISAAGPDSSSLRALWESLKINPFARWVNTYIGLNRAGSDIVRLVDWTREVANIDIDRVNLIGLGMGCLSTTQAAYALERIGLPPRTLTLVFPPADLQAAIAATYGNSWVAAAYGYFNEFMLRRMVLSETLPRTNIADKLLVIPKAEFEIPTYAVEPVKLYARNGRKKVSHIDIKYQGWSLPHYTRAIREEIYNWLLEKQAIAQ